MGDRIGDVYGLFRLEQRAAREPPLQGDWDARPFDGLRVSGGWGSLVFWAARFFVAGPPQNDMWERGGREKRGWIPALDGMTEGRDFWR